MSNSNYPAPTQFGSTRTALMEEAKRLIGETREIGENFGKHFEPRDHHNAEQVDTSERDALGPNARRRGWRLGL